MPRLPTRRISLIGRERDLGAIRDLVIGGVDRILTLTGPGGSGKTSLAVELAIEIEREFPDGVCLIELASIADPALVPQAVAAGVEVRERLDTGIRETLVSALRERAMLIVLDNCEHLLDACGDLVDLLLPECPRVRILATSREPLGISGEITWRVPALTTPDPTHVPDLAALAEFSAISLFTERARAVTPDFALTEANAASVARTCARLGGLPLAIELAAARVRVLPVQRIEERLEDGFRQFANRARMAPARHQTLWATLDWSHGLLSTPEQILFRRLGVFGGGFDLDSAEIVLGWDPIGPDQVLDLVTRLVDKSLLLVDQHDAHERYWLLEPVRQYAVEQLRASDDDGPAALRHAEYFAQLAEEAHSALRGPDQRLALARLDREHDNIRAGLAWAAGRSEALPLATRIVAAMHWYWWIHGHFAEGRRLTERIYQLSDGERSPARRLTGVAVGLYAGLQGEYERAAILATIEAESLAVGERATAAWAANLSAWVAEHRGDAVLAEQLAWRALDLSQQAKDDWLIGFSLQRLGESARGLNDYNSAERRLREALALFRKLGDQFGIANALNALGQLAQTRGAAGAAALLREGLENALAIGDQRRSAMCLEGLAAVAVQVGHFEVGVTLLGLADRLREQLGAPPEALYRERFARNVETARAALGDEAFQRTWERGRILTLASLPADLLRVDAPRSGAPSSALESPGRNLTKREITVATLIARGHSTRQIAEQISVDEHTVRQEVERILEKLDFITRRQLTDWVRAQSLADL